MANKKLRVTLVKSKYHTGRKHMATVQGLGLRRRHHTVELDDTPEVRGMIRKVQHMVSVAE
mgnify:CR=1 FL=1